MQYILNVKELINSDLADENSSSSSVKVGDEGGDKEKEKEDKQDDEDMERYQDTINPHSSDPISNLYDNVCKSSLNTYLRY